MAIISIIYDDRVLGSRYVPDKNLQIEGYLEGLRQDMIEEHDDILRVKKSEPRFEILQFNTKRIDKN